MTDRIRDAVADAVGSHYGAITRWHGPQARDWSWHFVAETAGRAPAVLVVKVPRWEAAPDLATALAAGPQLDTAEEFAALEAIQEAVLGSGDAGLAAVVPVSYVREVNAIVMERLNARPLRALLGWRRDGPAVTDVFGRLGRWLALFHGLGDPGPTPFLAAAEAVPGLPERSGALMAAIERLGAAARARDGRPVATGMVHGDLTLGNVLVTIDRRVAVIDPNRVRGRLSRDSAHLLGEVRLGRDQLLTARRLRPPQAVERWRAALLAAQPDLDPEVTRYDEVAAVVHRWSEFSARVPWPARRVADRSFAAEVTRLFDAC